LGWIYEYQSETKQALEHYLIAKSIYEETGNQKKLGYLMSLIGINQRYTGNYGDAIESQMQALKIGREIKDTLTINEALLALGFTYLKVEKWPEALDYQKLSLDLLVHMNDSTGIARVYSDMGVTHMSMDSLDAAIKDH
jgi:tetratricopeptide (TPR) repeat protein